MESPDMYPTAGDYANAKAQDALSENKKLRERIFQLENTLTKMEERLQRVEVKLKLKVRRY